MKVEIPKLITRLEKLQNSSKNLSWGHSLNEDNVWVLCCGHNVHKKILTLLVRENEGRYVVESDNCKCSEYSYLCLGKEDTVVYRVIELLKEVFPEIKRVIA